MDELEVDFSTDRDFEAINAKVLAFLKAASIEPGAVVQCALHQRGQGDTGRRFRFADTLETLAGQIATHLASYVNTSKSGATISIL